MSSASLGMTYNTLIALWPDFFKFCPQLYLRNRWSSGISNVVCWLTQY